MADIDCPYCSGHHDDRYLCDIGKRVLDTLNARRMVMTTPILEFPDAPVYDLPGDQVLVREIIVMSATVPIEDTEHLVPTLVFTGRDARDQPLPRWLYATDAHELLRFVSLVERMAHSAISAAARGPGKADG